MRSGVVELKVLSVVLQHDDGGWRVAMRAVHGEPQGGEVLRDPAGRAWELTGFSFVRTDAYIAGHRLLSVKPGSARPAC